MMMPNGQWTHPIYHFVIIVRVPTSMLRQVWLKKYPWTLGHFYYQR